MSKQEYQKRLYIILHNMDEITTISQAINAICLLNEEAIGENIDITKLDHLTGFVQQALGKNVLKQELKSVIGFTQ